MLIIKGAKLKNRNRPKNKEIDGLIQKLSIKNANYQPL
jgi:hypothetical protein